MGRASVSTIWVCGSNICEFAETLRQLQRWRPALCRVAPAITNRATTLRNITSYNHSSLRIQFCTWQFHDNLTSLYYFQQNPHIYLPTCKISFLFCILTLMYNAVNRYSNSQFVLVQPTQRGWDNNPPIVVFCSGNLSRHCQSRAWPSRWMEEPRRRTRT